jgi:hypothetical protein
MQIITRVYILTMIPISAKINATCESLSVRDRELKSKYSSFSSDKVDTCNQRETKFNGSLSFLLLKIFEVF